MSQLHKSKAFKAKEALKAKKQRNAARWKKGKKEGKSKKHAINIVTLGGYYDGRSMNFIH